MNGLVSGREWIVARRRMGRWERWDALLPTGMP